MREKPRTIRLITPKEGFFSFCLALSKYRVEAHARKQTPARVLNGMKVVSNQQQGIGRGEAEEGVGVRMGRWIRGKRWAPTTATAVRMWRVQPQQGGFCIRNAELNQPNSGWFWGPRQHSNSCLIPDLIQRHSLALGWGVGTLTSYFPPASTHAHRCPRGYLARKANTQSVTVAGPRHSVSRVPDWLTDRLEESRRVRWGERLLNHVNLPLKGLVCNTWPSLGFLNW